MTVMTGVMTGAQRMLAACRRQPSDVTPVWFMREAGRSLADYRRLREQFPILTLAKTPELDDAWHRIGYDKAIQGNLDPVRPLAGWDAARGGMRDVLDQAAGRPGHVCNLGHGVMPDTDPDVLKRLVDGVHAETGR
jgi:uroporphyrinogen-III decarboxylase